MNEHDFTRLGRTVHWRAHQTAKCPLRTVAVELVGIKTEILRQHRATGGVGRIYRATVGAELAELSAVEGLNHGVLTIRAADPATRYRLVQTLSMDNAEGRLIRAGRGKIRKVVVR